MASLYGGTSVNGYNANPPPDDGTTGSNNLIQWAQVKTKIGDPLNSFASTQDSAIVSGFGKTLDGASVVSTAVDYAATAADQGRLIVVTASGHTVTTPDAGTVHSPFIFAVNNQTTGTITLAGNATNSQTVDGQTSQTIQAGGSCLVKTDGTNWFTVGLKSGTVSLGGNNYGFDSAVNLNLQCSVGSSLLTVAIKTKAGNDPSASDPVLIAFRDTTLTTGDPVWVTISSALSISTNAIGATLASQNSKPFRFWILLFNNGGTPVLALWHSGSGASSLAINPLNEGTLQSTTGISAGATSAGVFYTPNGTTLSSKAFRILGYLEYTSGLSTAGTYSAAPDIVQLFGPGIKKPGEIVQKLKTVSTASGSGSNTYTQSTTVPTTGGSNSIVSQAITPSSASNIINVRGQVGYINGSVASSSTFTEFIYDGSNVKAVVGGGNGPVSGPVAGATPPPVEFWGAGYSGATTFTLYAGLNTGTFFWNSASGSGAGFFGALCATFISVEEIMG